MLSFAMFFVDCTGFLDVCVQFRIAAARVHSRNPDHRSHVGLIQVDAGAAGVDMLDKSLILTYVDDDES